MSCPNGTSAMGGPGATNGQNAMTGPGPANPRTAVNGPRGVHDGENGPTGGVAKGRAIVRDDGVYVYAVSRDLPGDATKAMRGVGGAPVRTVVESGLTALVSTVALADFGEDALRRNLEDLAWLESAARAHHAVVDAAAAIGATLPLGLATVYHGDDRVRKMLHERAAEFGTGLDRITGRTEWGVKGYAVAVPPTPDAPGHAGAAGDEPGRPGTSYLLRRRAERNSTEETRRDVLDVADRAHAELSGIAVAARLHPPQDPQLSGKAEWMILNAAYLVDDARGGEFGAVVRRLSGLRPGVSFQLTGPWAPYSFAGEEGVRAR